ncbi:MAG TPA: hypothetical protein ENH30_06450 [Nitrospirae bacterium]|nr:hypothetical protein [Nitrospirota bacterium]
MKLMHVEEFTDIIEAISREKQIKGWSRRKKEAIIAGDYEELVKLSESHPSTEPVLSGKTRKGEPFDRLRVTKKRQAWNDGSRRAQGVSLPFEMRKNQIFSGI